MKFKPGDIVIHQGFKWKVGTKLNIDYNVEDDAIIISPLEERNGFKVDGRWYWTRVDVTLFKPKKNHLPDWL